MISLPRHGKLSLDAAPRTAVAELLKPRAAGAMERRDRDGGALAGGRRLHSALWTRVSEPGSEAGRRQRGLRAPPFKTAAPSAGSRLTVCTCACVWHGRWGVDVDEAALLKYPAANDATSGIWSAAPTAATNAPAAL